MLFQIWHYKDTAQFDGKDPNTGLFVGYVNTFLKLKQEADGWPSWCTTEELKEKYVADYAKKEGKIVGNNSVAYAVHLSGIQLDPTKIARNPALRSLAKLMLNSHWYVFSEQLDGNTDEYFRGKFGQALQRSTRKFFTEKNISDYYETVLDPRNNISNIR